MHKGLNKISQSLCSMNVIWNCTVLAPYHYLVPMFGMCTQLHIRPAARCLVTEVTVSVYILPFTYVHHSIFRLYQTAIMHHDLWSMVRVIRTRGNRVRLGSDPDHPAAQTLIEAAPSVAGFSIAIDLTTYDNGGVFLFILHSVIKAKLPSLNRKWNYLIATITKPAQFFRGNEFWRGCETPEIGARCTHGMQRTARNTAVPERGAVTNTSFWNVHTLFLHK